MKKIILCLLSMAAATAQATTVHVANRYPNGKVKVQIEHKKLGFLKCADDIVEDVDYGYNKTYVSERTLAGKAECGIKELTITLDNFPPYIYTAKDLDKIWDNENNQKGSDRGSFDIIVRKVRYKVTQSGTETRELVEDQKEGIQRDVIIRKHE